MSIASAANDTPPDSERPLHRQRSQTPRTPVTATVRAVRGAPPRPAQPIAARSGAERVLELARKRGRAGVHQTDFDAGRVVDGGKPIRRLAARVDELKNQGHWFTTRRNRDRTTTYVLVRDAGALELALRAVSKADPERLFEIAPAAPLNAALTDWGVA